MDLEQFLKPELKYTFEGGKIFLSEPPQDITSSRALPRNTWTTWRKNNFDYFFKHLSQEPKNMVLADIGAGDSHFREITSRFKTYLAIDFYPYELVNIICDITKTLPLKDASCDIVFMSNVLEHTPNPEFLLKECNRVLRPNGMIIGTVPFLRDIHQAPYDFFRYTHFMLERMLKESDFKNRAVESLGNPLDIYQTMQQIFFGKLLKTEFSKNKFKNFLFKIIARLARKDFYLSSKFFGFVFKLAPASFEYTEGYGFKAYK